MKYSIELSCTSSEAWLEAVLNDFDAFLQDHADCERKASAMAMSFVAKYPNRVEIIPELIATAVEELEHFQDVYRVMESRNIQLAPEMKPDMYVKGLLSKIRHDVEGRFMDRLILASIIECRGAERFRMVSDSHPEEDMKLFYKIVITLQFYLIGLCFFR